MTAHPKPTRAKDPAYLAWLRKQPCCAPHSSGGQQARPGPTSHNLAAESDPHHTTSRGAGGGDDTCIPLWRGCHRDLESLSGAFKGWNRNRVRAFCEEMVRRHRKAYELFVTGAEDEDVPF